MKCFLILLFVLGAMVLAASVVMADVPQMINYQGRLTDDTGAAFNDNATMIFSIYDDSTAGSQLWQEVQAVVEVTDGLFHVILGSIEPIVDSVFLGPDQWLDIVVNGNHIEPRARLVSMAYAYRVSSIDGASGGIVGGDIEIGGTIGVGTPSNDSAGIKILRTASATGAAILIVDSAFGAGGYVGKHSDGPGLWVTHDGSNGECLGLFKKGGDGVGLWIIQRGNDPALHISSDTSDGANTLMTVGSDGRTGIGTNAPTEQLEVAGTIYSNSGGYRFPDGSVQTTAAGSGLFPAPAFNSGWFHLSNGGDTTFNHNLGQSPDNYFVNVEFWETGVQWLGRHNDGIGTFLGASDFERGGYYKNLLSNSIQMYRGMGDPFCDSIRVRIWITQ